MTAGQNFDSYPYLHLSRRLMVPYRDILAEVDILEGKRTVGYFQCLNPTDQLAVETVFRRHEQERST